MSRFGLRKKIKGLISKPEQQPVAKSFSVEMTLPDGEVHRVTAEPKYTLVMASQSLDTPIEVGCPDGNCGGCVVDVTCGDGISGPTEREMSLLIEHHEGSDPSHVRLACHARVIGDGSKVTVRKVWSMEDALGG